MTWVWGVIGLGCTHGGPVAAFERELTFEAEHDGGPAGWSARPEDAATLDAEGAFEGEWAVRLDRDEDSEGEFSTLVRTLPVDFEGRLVRLRGQIRTEGVTGYAGLWIRLDGPGGTVALEHLDDPIEGTQPWKRHVVQAQLESGVTHLTFGGLIVGTGSAWFDDLQLVVDGKPLDRASPKEPSVVVTDREFEAGSGIADGELTDVQVRNVALLGEVWGFLKYHHPRVTNGQLHWDFELFRALPAVLRAADEIEGRSAVLALVERVGLPEPCKPCAEPLVEPALDPPLAWLTDEERLGPDVASALQTVYERRHAKGAQAYVRLAPGVGNAVLSMEQSYDTLGHPDAGYRLLALMRLWSVVRYWFPYRDLLEDDWRDVLVEFVPRLVAADDADTYRIELIELIGRVHDTHANLWGSTDVVPPRGDHALPIQLRFVGERAVVWEVLDGTPFQRGDVVVAIDDETVEQRIARTARAYPASNEPTRLRNQARFLTRGPAGPAKVVLSRGDERVELDVERRPSTEMELQWGRHDRAGEAMQRLGEHIAYLKLSSVVAGDVPAYLEAAKGTRGLVIDLRCYPSEFVVFALGQHLVASPTPFARFTTGSLANPGAFGWTEPVTLQPAEPSYAGQIVILVDEVTQSQAEYTSMAFRSAPGALVVGSTTAGADGNYSALSLPGGLRTGLSGIGVFYPDRTPTQRVGILPDVQARPTVEGIRAGRDEVLEEALRQILGEDADQQAIIELARR
ncbi:MAG: hypothetical protein KTR31_06805 [Myxococcales bacterium]|nr:hypothetical protein [Myxococcales bacterium]